MTHKDRVLGYGAGCALVALLIAPVSLIGSGVLLLFAGSCAFEHFTLIGSEDADDK